MQKEADSKLKDASEKQQQADELWKKAAEK